MSEPTHVGCYGSGVQGAIKCFGEFSREGGRPACRHNSNADARLRRAHLDIALDSGGNNGAPISGPARLWENSTPAVPKAGTPGAVRDAPVARAVGFACSGAASMRIYGVRSVVGTHESVMINRRNILRLLAMLVSGALAMKASANGFGLADQDAFATARGEAFVATADNPSAIYYNPAGITQLEGNNLRGGIYGIYLDSSYSPPSSAPTTAILMTTRTIWPPFPRFSTPTLPRTCR